jgi:secernin
VVGGNTAIFTKSLHLENFTGTTGLTGMDLLRFGLERGPSAERAVEAIIELLERYGQWGSAVARTPHEKGCYENAFLLADAKEAWVLETTGKRWIAEKIDSGFRALSNQPTIRDVWTKSSPDLEEFALNHGWWSRRRGAFDFAHAYGDHAHYSRQVSHIRWKRVNDLLLRSAGDIGAATVMSILRDHYEDTFLEGPQFHPYLPDFHTICMHDSPAGFTWGNTATSIIVEIASDGEEPPKIWLAYLPPCTSIYLGLPWSDRFPEIITNTGTAGLSVLPPIDAPVDTFRDTSLWWRFHRIIEAVRENPHDRAADARELFRPLERKNLTAFASLQQKKDGDPEAGRFMEHQLQGVVDALRSLEKQWGLSWLG